MRLALALCAAVVAGCASPSANMRIGSETMALSLQDQRAASNTIVVAQAVPPGAQVVGAVDASRCHRFQGDIEPTDEMVMADLKVAAFARGADGIAGASIVREVGLTRNCWYILTGRATAFTAAKAGRVQ